MTTMFEQLAELAFDPRQVVRVHAVSPEVRALQIVARFIAEPIPDVLADEGRAKVARGLEAVDHRRRGREELLDMGARRGDRLLRRLALSDVVPRSDDLLRLAALVMCQAQLVADPA